jgi:hypothetical protein
MIRLKAAPSVSRPLVPLPTAAAVVLAIAFAAALSGTLLAQSPKTITILMLDGKTGKPLVPDNYMVRIDHLNQLHNEALKVNDDGSGKVTVPDSASFLAVQGTYHGSIEIYVNCDAGMEKDTSALHWYSIADILNAGVVTPNECYKGKYANSAITAKPGEFVFFVRETNWRESSK